MEQKFKRGTLVEVLVGHQVWSSKDGVIDISPENIGRKAIIEYSYAEKYGGSGNLLNSYSIIYQDTGSSEAWKDLNELKFIDEGGEHLIKEAKETYERLQKEYTSLAYIISHLEEGKINSEGLLILFELLGYKSRFWHSGEFYFLWAEWRIFQPVFIHIKHSDTLEQALAMDTDLNLAIFDIKAVFDAFKKYK